MATRMNPDELRLQRKQGLRTKRLPFYVSGAQTAAAGKVFFLAPEAGRVLTVSFTLAGQAHAGTDFIVDCNINGTTVYTTQANRPTLADDDDPYVSSEAAAPEAASFVEGDVLSIDVDQIGDGTAGSGLAGYVEYQA